MLLVDRRTFLEVSRLKDSVEHRPRNLYDLIREVSCRVFGGEPAPISLRRILVRGSVSYCFNPSIFALSAAVSPKCGSVYLCWGTPDEDRGWFANILRYTLLRAILRSSDIVQVNEQTTAAAIKRISGRHNVDVVTYLVDSKFFRPPTSDLRQASGFILVPGNNGRDEALVLKLSSAGLPIVRITSEPRVIAQYKTFGWPERYPNLRLSFNVGWMELRELYRGCSAVFLPMLKVNHAAGQTAMLEAAACGARIISLRTRLAGIPAKGVLEEVDHLSFQEIVEFLGCAVELAEPWALRIDRASRLRETFSYERCVDVVSESIHRALANAEADKNT